MANVIKILRDKAHVYVARLDTTPVTYVKRWRPYDQQTNPGGMPFADYWAERESALITHLNSAGIEHVVQYNGIDKSKCEITTIDAGPSLDRWREFKVEMDKGEELLHPFVRADEFLKLLRWCLISLKGVHQAGFVHCDIKEDNFCVPERVIEGDKLYLDYSNLSIIDFAFSTARHNRLKRWIPIDSKLSDYLSPALRKALEADQNNLMPGEIEKVSYHSDLYSLKHMAWRYFTRGLAYPADRGLRAADVEAFLEYLDEMVRDVAEAPEEEEIGGLHDHFVGQIDELLNPVCDDFTKSRGFVKLGVNVVVRQSTPITPMFNSGQHAAGAPGRVSSAGKASPARAASVPAGPGAPVRPEVGSAGSSGSSGLAGSAGSSGSADSANVSNVPNVPNIPNIPNLPGATTGRIAKISLKQAPVVVSRARKEYLFKSLLVLLFLVLLVSGGWLSLNEARRAEWQEPIINESTGLTIQVDGKSAVEPLTAMELVWVEGGCFWMGSPDGGRSRKDRRGEWVEDARAWEEGRDDNEGPVHEVCVDSFWVSKYEVTNQQYRLHKPEHDSGVYKNKSLNGSEQPVVDVTWDDAASYAAWLGEKTKVPFRLPTEAEWEYAARAGTTTPFFFGRTLSAHQANYDGGFVYGSGIGKGPYRQTTIRVGFFPQNAFGVHDMHGNVWEWCADWYNKEYYSSSGGYNPQGPDKGMHRVVRGGGWFNLPASLRSAIRLSYAPGFHVNYLGFRLAVSGSAVIAE